MQKFKKIDQYQLMEILGKGANGFVYKGLNTLNGSLVAIKELFIGKSEVKSIKTQLSLLKNLDHPCIVKFIDAIQKQNKIYLVLEFMEGGSLAVLVKKSPLHEDVAKIYVKQILRGLSFLHKKQVIHRDIKGANILLTKNGLIKLADFGVAVKLEDNQKTISAAGSPYWMAPQIISSNGQKPSIKCDIWSLGCTIIQLLTGNPPYHNLMQFPALFRIVEDKHPPLPTCSPECKQFLLACFIKDSIKRPSADELLNFAWLRNANQIQTKQTLESQDQLSKEISACFVPVLKYAELFKILDRRGNALAICNNKYFQVICHDKTNNTQRLNLVVSLIQKQINCIQILDKLGIIRQQYANFQSKSQPKEQKCKLFTQLNHLITNIYCNKMNEFQNNKALFLVSEDTVLSAIETIFLNFCIGNFCKLIEIFSRKNVLEMLELLIQCIRKFISTIDCYKKEEQKAQMMIQILNQMHDSQCLKQLLAYKFCDKQDEENVQSDLNRLEFLQKILPYYKFLLQMKPTFKKYITLTIRSVLKNGIWNENQLIIFAKFICLMKLIAYPSLEGNKAELEKQGIIYYLSQYYRVLVANLQNISKGTLYESFAFLEQFMMNSKKGVDRNRVLQFKRHQGSTYCLLILKHFCQKNEETTKIQNGMHQKIICLINILER